MSTQQQETIDRLKKQAAEGDGEEETIADPEPSDGNEDKRRNTTREYVVFQADAKGVWTEITRADAATFEDAVETLGEHLKSGVRYGGTPSRNWHEVEPEVETTTTVKLKRVK